MVNGKKLIVGDDIDSQCLKCKAVTNHTIIALTGEKPAKVQCNVCDARHNYRPPKEKKSAAAKKSSRAATAKAKKQTLKEQKAAAAYEDLTAGRDLSKAVPYAMTETFEFNDLIKHPTFGLGVVTDAIVPNKIEVTFKEGTRVLICVVQSPYYSMKKK